MRRAAAALVSCLALASPAQAGLTADVLATVGVNEARASVLPLAATLRDLDGRSMSLREALGGHPALLLPADYRCQNLCGPALAVLAPLLDRTRLQVGRDFSVIALGIDPRDGADAARTMAEARFGAELGRPGLFVLTGEKDVVGAVLSAAGYRVAYDTALDRIAHPAAAFAVAADGTVLHSLSTLALTETDLDLAMTEAADGAAGSLSDRVLLLCYGYDPTRGAYTPAVRRVLAAAGLLTLTGLGFGILALRRRDSGCRGAP